MAERGVVSAAAPAPRENYDASLVRLPMHIIRYPSMRGPVMVQRRKACVQVSRCMPLIRCDCHCCPQECICAPADLESHKF